MVEFDRAKLFFGEWGKQVKETLIYTAQQVAHALTSTKNKLERYLPAVPGIVSPWPPGNRFPDNSLQDGRERSISTTTGFPTSQKTAIDTERRDQRV